MGNRRKGWEEKEEKRRNRENTYPATTAFDNQIKKFKSLTLRSPTVAFWQLQESQWIKERKKGRKGGREGGRKEGRKEEKKEYKKILVDGSQK